MLETIQPFLLSFLMGLLIGIERERSQIKGAKAIGMRTFILFALLGTLAAQLDKFSITLTLSLFVFTALLISYFRITEITSKYRGHGLTTEMAGASVYILGYLVFYQRLLAILIATIVLVILYGKRSLHRFAIEKITAQEIEAAITILIISLGIISFLPNKTIDPWQIFNPQNLGIIIMIVAGLQFGGYIVIRIFGEQLGMMFIGFFGGFVSSTAIFASLSEVQKKKRQNVFSAVVAGIFATIATLIAFMIVVFVVAPTLLQHIIWPILTAIIIGSSSSILFIKKNHHKPIKISYPNPLDLKSIAKLAALIITVLLIVAVTKQYIGPKGLSITAFITGLLELQGIAYAIALLYAEQRLTLTYASELLALALLASFISKYFLIWLIAHNRFSLIMSIYLTVMLAGAAIVYSIFMI